MNTSGASIGAILDSLRRLNAVTLRFVESFWNAETNDVYDDEQPIRILSELNIKTRKKLNNGKYKPSKSEGYVAFHPRILKNLIRQYTRPVLFDVVLSLKSDIAQFVYAVADRQLASKPEYNITTANLFNELSMEGAGYRYVSKRMEKLKAPLAELEGKPLSSGGALRITQRESKDKQDIVLIFSKGKRLLVLPAPVVAEDHATVVQVNGDDASHVAQLRNAGITERKARELVADHRQSVERELEAWPHRDKSKMKEPSAWLIKAIQSGDYSQPQAVETKRQAKEFSEKRKREEQETARLRVEYRKVLEAEFETLKREHKEQYEAFAKSFAREWESTKHLFGDKPDDHKQEAELFRLEWFAGWHRDFPVPTFDEWLARA